MNNTTQAFSNRPLKKEPFKILVADDHPYNIKLVTLRLADEGYRFITANDGDEALQQARAELPDLVLLDVQMPFKDGFKVLQEMRADPALAHIPVIILTATHPEPRDIRTGLNLGAEDYLTKPFNWYQLPARIRVCLRLKVAEDALRQREHELELLPQMSRELSGWVDETELAERLLRQAMLALAASHGYLVVVRADDRSFYAMHESRVAHAWSWDPAQQRLASQGVINAVIESRQAALIEDTRLDPRWLSEPNDPTRSVLAVPILGSREVLGALTLYHTLPGYFSPASLRLLEAIAGQAAVAIENARLARELDRVKKEFVMLVAHDLKSPLTALLAYTTLLARAGPLTADQGKFVENMRQIGFRMNDMLQQLIEFMQVETATELPLEPLDLKTILIDLALEFQPEAELKQLALEFVAPPTALPVLGNSARLQQALRNLLSNAIKYTPAGGSVTLTAGHGSQVWVKVQDTGSGIPMSDLPHIFDKFYRARGEASSIEGYGLGLFIAKTIIEQHSGEIMVESAMGEGSQFIISLPCAPSSS